MLATLHDSHKEEKLTTFLQSVEDGKKIKAGDVSKKFCLKNAVSAGKKILMHGGFESCGDGTWIKVGAND